MSKPAQENVLYPFNAFNFAVEARVPGVVDGEVCSAAFAECDGLEVTREVKSIREGGNNGVQIRLSGPVAYGTLSLKRGMTANFDLWDWFQASLDNPTLRVDVAVVLFTATRAGTAARDRRSEATRFLLTRCLPVKLKAPSLHAREGLIAIEEFQLAYERLERQRRP